MPQFWPIAEIRIIQEQLDRNDRLLAELVSQNRGLRGQVESIHAIVRQNNSLLLQLLDIFTAKPTHLMLVIGTGDVMPLNVGAQTTATVTVLDQFGQPMTDFDFNANPPAPSLNDNNATLSPGPALNEFVITGETAGPETLTVDVPGVANGSASLSFNVAEADRVPTSVQLVTNPDVTG